MARLWPVEWWRWLTRQNAHGPLFGKKYKVIKSLYSFDGKRRADVCKFAWDKTYLLESDRAEDGSWVPRHEGKVVGPFDNPSAAEHFIVATDWFNGTGKK